MSHLSNAYGFGSDNVVAYELVLANATAITVTPHSHADLFYALKAGGNNYGKLPLLPSFHMLTCHQASSPT